MPLRDYQIESFNEAQTWLKKCVDPAIIELATGAGKSHIVSALAEWLNNISGKKVLCLAPSKELVQQNHKAYLKTGNPASIYCASINKSLTHDVVFGSPRTVLNDIDKFCDRFCAVVIDECHEITPTIKDIVSSLRAKNKKIRVLGLTATPYRMNSGYIYSYNEDGLHVGEDKTKDPYFNKCLHRVTAQFLIEQGYLTAPHADPDHIDGYAAETLQVNSRGQFDAKEIEQVFEGKGRKTAAIVADIVDKSANRFGVMIFAATRQHAEEVMLSLPQGNAKMVTGKTPKNEREQIVSDYKNRKFKYLVNVAVFTRGFDAPHVDVVAILRATESVTLLQQIIGRGLRLVDPATAGDLHAISKTSKPDCLILDYAKNIERHCPDGDLFNPNIKVAYSNSESVEIDVVCPSCFTTNMFKIRENPEKFDVDQYGYFVDLAGNRITNDDDQEIPAHHGRRCFGQRIVQGSNEQCEYRWTFKECLDCGHQNDIAARYCESCKGELIDPNEKLVIEFTKMKKDPYRLTTDKVLSWRCQLWSSQNGNETVKVDYTTDYNSFSVWYFPSKIAKRQRQWESLCQAAFGEYVNTPADFMERVDNFEASMPKTITSKRDKDSKFFDVYGHNKPEDVLNEIP